MALRHEALRREHLVENAPFRHKKSMRSLSLGHKDPIIAVRSESGVSRHSFITYKSKTVLS
jgi:hypothetical protein